MALPKKYEHIDFKPSKGVASEAEKGLKYRERSGKGGLSSQEAGEAGIGSGVQRAVNLKNRNNLTPDTIDMMLGFFSRHEKNKSISPSNRDTPWEDAGYVAWLLWGGDAGKKWAEGIKAQMDKADKEQEAEKSKKASAGEHKLPPLPYSYDALEPYISENTLRQHHGKHHKAYVDGLNKTEKAIEGARQDGDFESIPALNAALQFHAGGDYLHRLYWPSLLSPKDYKDPSPEFLGVVEKDFGSWEDFKNQLKESTVKVRGSGWGVLVQTPDGMRILTVMNHENGVLWNANVLLPVDAWEHAYYLDYQSDRDAYFDALFDHLVDWAKVESRLKKSSKKASMNPLDSLGYGALSVEKKFELDRVSETFPIDLEELPLAPRPQNMSDQTREELLYLLHLQREVRPYQLNRVESSNEDPLVHVKEYCLQNSLPVDSTPHFLSEEARPLIMKLKRFFDRPRPYQLAPLHGLEEFSPLELSTTGTPSYPSGHTIQAFLGALYLAEKYPEHAEGILNAARKTSLDRMVAGVHFPSDVIYGEVLARQIYPLQVVKRVKNACVIAAGTFGDSYCLFKNRDRNYIPEVSLIHELRGGVEVLYLKDDVTGWTEGMNALGIGIVNSALMVARDETEFELVQKGQVLPDGEIILEALSRRNVLEAAHIVRHYKGGLLGHTVVSDGKRSYYVELPDEDKVAYNELSLNRLFTRTNHGVKFRNTGYTVQDRYRASVERRLKSLSVLREVETPEELAPDLMRSRDVRVHLHEAIQDSRSKKRMRTTSQMVLDLTNLELLLYLFPERVDWKGYKNRLPAGYEPQIRFRVEEYKDLSLKGSGETRSIQKSAILRVAARYKEKKKVPKADGSGDMTVYVYSERQIQNRHREKAERLQNFKPKLENLRSQLKKDLDSEDPKIFLTALAISLIDATYERVGNEGSAENGHYGVTGWLKKHVTIKNDKAIIRYVGKSGVKHEKRVDDDSLVKALKRCCGDKSPDETILSLEDSQVSSRDVNDYLKPYEITAKDLRGFHANREMQERLQEIRKNGPRLPRLRKERDKILKAEFKEALEGASESVGHEPATLRGQYLVPALEEAYMKDGTIIKNLKGATKSQSELEDEHAEGLVGPSPKKKPPREDLKKRRMDESSSDPDEKQDSKDRSQNYKDACVRVAARWLFAQDDPKSPEDRLKERAKKEFEAYKEEHPKTELTEADFLARLEKAGIKGDSPEESDEDKKKSKEKMKVEDEKKKDEANKKAMGALEGQWKEAFKNMELTDENKKKFSDALDKFGPEDREKFVKTFSTSLKTLKTDASTYDPAKTADLLKAMKKRVTGTSPENLGDLAAKAIFADRVALNPEMMNPGDPVASEDNEGEGTDSSDIQKASRRTSLALARFDKASPDEIEEFSKRLDSLIDEAPSDSPRQRQFMAMKHGLNLSRSLKENSEEPPEGVAPLEFLMMKAIKKKGGDLGSLAEVSFRSASRDESSGAALASELESAIKDMSMSEAMRILPTEYQSIGASVLEHAIASATRLNPDGTEAPEQSKERARLVAARDETEKEMKQKLVEMMTQEASKKSKGEPTPMPPAPLFSAKGGGKSSISDWFDDLRLDLFSD